MTQYRWPIVTGDRVALAPHTDEWMSGRRFGIVVAIETVRPLYDARRYRVQFEDGYERHLMSDALLGATGSTPSEVPAPHGVPLCGHPEHEEG